MDDFDIISKANIDENYANFIKDEEIIVNYNQIALIDNNEWTILKNDVNNRIKNVLINDEYKKNNPKNNKRKSKRKKYGKYRKTHY